MSVNSLAKQSLSRDMNFYSINIIIFCTFWTLFKLFIFFFHVTFYWEAITKLVMDAFLSYKKRV